MKRVKEWDELGNEYEADLDVPAPDMAADVSAFHRKFGCDKDNRTTPGNPRKGVGDLRFRLVQEEFGELAIAHGDGDVAEVADALADLIYVAIGMALAYGIDLRPVWREVHRSNMAKSGGGTREDGKILKPEGWTPPDIAGVLRRQGWEG